MTERTTGDEPEADVASPEDGVVVAPGEPRPFDFRRPNKFSREHVRALSLVLESFVREFSTALSATLRSVSQVTVGTVEQLSYDDYVDQSPNPSLLAVVSLEPLADRAILQLPLPLTMGILDRMLGGSGQGDYPIRPLTDVERGLITEVINRALTELAGAFESLLPLQPAIRDLESNPHFAHLAAASDLVVVVGFETTVGAIEGQMSLCIPFTELEPRLEIITGAHLVGDRRMADRAAAAAAMGLALQDVPVDVSVRFAPVTLTSDEVVNLRAGDVVPLHHPCDRPLELFADGVPLLPAMAGRRRNRLACRVVDPDLEGAT